MFIIGQGWPKLEQVVWQADPQSYLSCSRVQLICANVSKSDQVPRIITMH